MDLLDNNLVILPKQDFCSKANLQQEQYLALKDLFEIDPEKFWRSLATSELLWSKQFTKIFNYKDKPFFEWFADGQINISYNCIDRHLQERGAKTAIIFEDERGNNQSLSYFELHKQVCRTANMLKNLGVVKGDVVCIYLPLCPEAIVAMHACNRIGAIHTVVFAGFSAQALEDRILDCQAKIVITANGFIRKNNIVPLLETVLKACQGLELVSNIVSLKKIPDLDVPLDPRIQCWQELLGEAEDDCDPELNNSEDPSFILYTSGSTGKPKGIKHSTAGYLLWAHLTSKWVFDLSQKDIFWCTADIGWITGHSYVAYGPLSNGATIFIYEGAPDIPDQSRFWSLIDKYKITIFYTAPTAIRTFMQWGLEHVKNYSLKSLRLLGSVGEPINPTAWLWFYEHIGKSRCPIVDTWWQTETGAIVVTTLPGIHAMKPGSAGLALPGVTVNVNPEGLLYIQDPIPSMARTIHNDDSRYVETYWSQIPGHYTAGDAATKDSNGYITISGRVDDVINVSGHRLGTAEIESALVSHDLVSEAAVVAIPHEIKGEAVVAFVVTNTNELPSDIEEILKDQVKQSIGALARPEQIIICKGLPKTRSGKIVRRLLKDIALGKEPRGDISTLENKSILEEIYKALENNL